MGSQGPDVQEFLAAHTARRRELEAAWHRAYWEASTTGDPGAAERLAEAEARARKQYADRDAAARVRRWLADADRLDPLVRRQLVVVDLQYAGNLLPAETIDDLTRRSAEIERIFTVFRARLGGERVGNNRLLEILRGERDGEQRRAAWEASKQVGREVAEPLRELVRRRNTAARTLGFENFYAMGLALQEQDEAGLFALLDDFEARSDEPFRALREQVDRGLADRFGIAPEELRPWHWADPFGQEAPVLGGLELDPLFAGLDTVRLAREFFAGIGLPVDEILERSDLWERDGKAQHAFATDIDREGDVRILCNLRPDEHWTMVLLHELGHAVYDRHIPRSVPWLLRMPAHTLSTEAIAMFMGRLTRDPAWLADMAGATFGHAERAEIREQLRLKMMVAARWILVMAHFERALYRDPDRADLGDLWWSLVERLQRIRRPEGRAEPDWAAKIHLSAAPVYYHNYLLGEWMASQLDATLQRDVLRGAPLTGDTRVGDFFRDRVFAHGAMLNWNDLLVAATGTGLDPTHFVDQFVTPGP